MLLPQCAQLQCHKRGSAAASLSPILMEQQIPLSSLHTHKFPCLSLSLSTGSVIHYYYYYYFTS